MASTKPQCGSEKEDAEYDLGLHVAGLFLVLGVSCIGCGFPVAAKKIKWMKIPPKVFFACKHFGTGVLIATAFVHLLPTAFQSLGDPCLPNLFTEDYPAIPGLIMMASLFALFVVEMLLNSKAGGHSHGGPTGHDHTHLTRPLEGAHKQQNPDYDFPLGDKCDSDIRAVKEIYERSVESRLYGHEENQHSLSTIPPWFVVFYEQYVRQHHEMLQIVSSTQFGGGKDEKKQNVTVAEVTHLDEESQLVDPHVFKKISTNITLLEGGILFHSVFVGMTVSITVKGFLVLLIAILFHQMFEGLGLGSRIAAVPYPKGSIRPWVLVIAFGTTAPIGQAIGLITRNSYDPRSAFGLIIVGIFNAISSGLLIYAALVDLLAEDFLSEEANRLMDNKKAITFGWVLLGATGMAIVGAFA